jgi:hypothetical protein
MRTFIQPQHKLFIVAAYHDPTIDHCEVVQHPVLALICDPEDRHDYDFLFLGQDENGELHYWNDYNKDDSNILCYDIVLESELPIVLHYYQTRDCDGCCYRTYTEMTARREAEEKYMRENNPAAI